ncbi:hypothetical protein CYMTET_30993, partial [Cymbomonas tetramitiformis]
MYQLPTCDESPPPPSPPPSPPPPTLDLTGSNTVYYQGSKDTTCLQIASDDVVYVNATVLLGPERLSWEFNVTAGAQPNQSILLLHTTLRS